MSNEPTPSLVQAVSISTTLHVLLALAEDRLQSLQLDAPEYLADLYCVDRIANALGIQLALTGAIGHPLVASAIDQCRRISDLLEAAYRSRGIDPERWCLKLDEGMLRRHPGSAAQS